MRLLLLSTFILLVQSLSFSQKSPSREGSDPKWPDSLNRKKLYTAIGTEAVFYTAGISYLRYVWYRDKERVPFHWYDDGAGYKQIDKFGHAYGAYIGSYIGYHWLRAAGVTRKKALLYGGTLGLVLQTPIEVFDGMYKGWASPGGKLQLMLPAPAL